MTTRYADRIEDIQSFKVMDLLARARALESQGNDVIHMEVGEPDFTTPAPIIAAGQSALTQKLTQYTEAQGIPELRSAVAAHYLARYGIDINPSRIFITSGSSGALSLVSALLLNAGDGMLLADPGYPCTRHFIRTFHGDPQLVAVDCTSRYQLTAELVEQHWQHNTRGVMLASPANPTGAVIDSKTLQEISDVVARRNGHLVVDEIYQGLAYGEYASGAPTILSLTNQAFVVNSFSKYFGMTGWRLGWLVVPEAAIDDIVKLAQNLFICASTVAQHAALAAFGPESMRIVESQRCEFAQRRDFLVSALRNLGFSIPIDPDGAFYVYAGLPDDFPDSESFCDQLLEKYFIAATPGTDFGFAAANRHVRFTYCQDLSRLQEAVTRLQSVFNDRYSFTASPTAQSSMKSRNQ